MSTMCKHSKVGVSGKRQEDPAGVPNSSLKYLEQTVVVGSRTRSQHSSLHNENTSGRRILTRSASSLFRKLKNSRKRTMFQRLKPGVRSSSRLNKPRDRLLITRASRQAADLCNGVAFGAVPNPSNKLLFMLSLGLSPNLKSASSCRFPAVVLDRLAVSNSRLSYPTVKLERKPIQIQSTKENIEAENVRITRRMAAITSKSDRKLRSNQDVNKMANLRSKQLSSGSKSLSSKSKGRLNRLAENVATRIEAQVLRVRKGLQEEKSNIPTLYLVKKCMKKSDTKRKVICIDLTGDREDKVGGNSFSEFKKKYGTFMHPICC